MNDEINYLLVTPAKDESQNIPRLVSSVAKQTIVPKIWILVDDGSVDHTPSIFISELEKYSNLKSNTKTLIVSHEHKNKEYALGAKYASVVKYGLDAALAKIESTDIPISYFGVLDCDVFPNEKYYEFLIRKFIEDPKLGIVSGGTLLEETHDQGIVKSACNRGHAPGGLRLWRKECLCQTGYKITISQDAVSEARAILMGWRVRSFPEISVSLRKRGSKYGYAYYGRSAYIRCVPYWYVMLAAFRMALLGRKEDAAQYLTGYNEARNEKAPQIEDRLAIRYFKNIFWYRIIGR